MPSERKRFSLITLGEELLMGLTPNGHLTFIGEQLRQRGVTLHSNHTISDQSEDIETYFQRSWNEADVIITTGGLGPTVDDRTRECVAQLLGEQLVFDDEIQQAINDRFAERGQKPTPNNRKQAYRMEHSEALKNPNGTAPGLWLEKDGKLLIMMPGPPSELQPMFTDTVLPRLESLGWIDASENYIQLRTIGVGESALETLFQPVFDKYDGLNVAYCAHPGQVDVRLSFDSVEREDELLDIADRCKRELGADFIGYGNDSLVQVALNILIKKNLSFAVAESCTGGMIANEITDVPGSSQTFIGGIVSYAEDAKMDLLNVPEEMIHQHGVVSKEVAIAMAAGLSERMEADYCLSVTGYAGPTGGTPENPVGTAYIGLSSQNGVWGKKVRYRGSRQIVKRRIAQAAMDWLRRELLNEFCSEECKDHAELREESRKILRSLG